MFSSLTDIGFSLLVTFDLPALFVLFILKGAIIGKPFPTSVFLPGYIAVSPPGSQSGSSSSSLRSATLAASCSFIGWLQPAAST